MNKTSTKLLLKLEKCIFTHSYEKKNHKIEIQVYKIQNSNY